MEDSTDQQDQAKIASSPGYLDQMAKELSRQRELINSLAMTLDPVSDRTPQEAPAENPTPVPHLSTLLYVMRNANNDLDKILNEIAL